MSGYRKRSKTINIKKTKRLGITKNLEIMRQEEKETSKIALRVLACGSAHWGMKPKFGGEDHKLSFVPDDFKIGLGYPKKVSSEKLDIWT